MNFATSLMNEYANDVSSGKYKTVDEAGKDIQQRLNTSMMKHMAERQAGPASGPATGPTSKPQG